jgi:hypothetical protein
MPRLSEAMKDVISCEKLRGGAIRLIRRFPNGATHLVEDRYPQVGGNPGTETSKYPEEEKTIVIPQVVASERGLAQTITLRHNWGCRTTIIEDHLNRESFGKFTIEGESPVHGK